MAQDPQMAAPEDESQEQFSVTITANGDGTYTVTPSDSDEAQDDPNGGDGSQTADSPEEAAQIAQKMLEDEVSEDSGESGNGDAPIPADQAQKVWDQMAKGRDKARAM